MSAPLAGEHYLGYRSAAGKISSTFCARSKSDRWRPECLEPQPSTCKVRNDWIGWSESDRAKGLTRVTDNTRFLI
jgi:hypothetical protein